MCLQAALTLNLAQWSGAFNSSRSFVAVLGEVWNELETNLPPLWIENKGYCHSQYGRSCTGHESSLLTAQHRFDIHEYFGLISWLFNLLTCTYSPVVTAYCAYSHSEMRIGPFHKMATALRIFVQVGSDATEAYWGRIYRSRVSH